MAFADSLKKLNAQRLQQSVKATVQSNGRLTFTVEATKVMDLSDEKSLIIFEAENGDLGATISHKGDPDAFELKKCGLYFYVAFKNYLQQAGIDYKGQRIIYDITELDEKLDERTLYKFERRVLPKSPEQLPYTDASVDNGAGNGDGSGSGAGAGCGAGNGDGSGSGEPAEQEDADLPPDAPEAVATPSESPVRPTMPPPPPARPTRPMPPPPPPPARPTRPMPPPPPMPTRPARPMPPPPQIRPDAPSAEELARRAEEFADNAMKNLSQEQIAELAKEALAAGIEPSAAKPEDKTHKDGDWSF